MRYCKECRLKLKDDEEYCRRCGSTNIGYIPDDEYEKRKQQKQQKQTQGFETNIRQESVSRDTFDNESRQERQKSRVENNNINIYGDNSNSDEIVTFKEWLINGLLLMIPIYGLIRLITIVIGSSRYKTSMVNCYRAVVVTGFISSLAFTIIMKLILSPLLSGLFY